ncbi:MAG: glycine C-acetyltransferase [Parvularculales bacterium]
MKQAFLTHISRMLDEIKSDGLYKNERAITSPQSGKITVAAGSPDGKPQLNLCSNNYLGLANHPDLIAAAKQGMDTYGYGMASVRFICGTQDLHHKLEKRLASYLEKDDAILYAACFDANGGLFEPLLAPEDAIISDSLNHASIIDGIRLCKAKRYRYRNSDMADLEVQLQQARKDGARFIIIATDGVFSMDGTLANLPEVTRLAEVYEAIVMVDDCHSTGFMGPGGRGTGAHFGLSDKVDIVTGTLGKALGGAIGGFIAGPKVIIDLLRQRSRPYLFSNALPPGVCAASLEALRLAEEGDDLRRLLFDNAYYWRCGLQELGFKLNDGEHPIIPVMLGDAKLSQRMAGLLNDKGVYVAGFFHPVVPRGTARIRTQMSAALTREELDTALAAFAEAGREAGALS